MKIKRLGNAYCAVRIGTPPGDLLPVSETTFTAYLHSALKIQDQMLVVTIAAICRGRTGTGFLASTPARTLLSTSHSPGEMKQYQSLRLLILEELR